MKIYLSSSLSEEDKPLRERLVQVAADYGVTIVSGPRPWPAQDAVPPEVAEAIDSADFAFFWISADGPDVSCINLEAGYIRNSARRLPFLIFSPNGLEPAGCLKYRPFIVFYLRDARITLEQMWNPIHHEYRERPQMAAAIHGVLIALVGMLLMRRAPEAPASEAEEKRQDQLRDAAAALRGSQP